MTFLQYRYSGITKFLNFGKKTSPRDSYPRLKYNKKLHELCFSVKVMSDL